MIKKVTAVALSIILVGQAMGDVILPLGSMVDPTPVTSQSTFDSYVQICETQGDELQHDSNHYAYYENQNAIVGFRRSYNLAGNSSLSDSLVAGTTVYTYNPYSVMNVPQFEVRSNVNPGDTANHNNSLIVNSLLTKTGTRVNFTPTNRGFAGGIAFKGKYQEYNPGNANGSLNYGYRKVSDLFANPIPRNFERTNLRTPGELRSCRRYYVAKCGDGIIDNATAQTSTCQDGNNNGVNEPEDSDGIASINGGCINGGQGISVGSNFILRSSVPSYKETCEFDAQFPNGFKIVNGNKVATACNVETCKESTTPTDPSCTLTINGIPYYGTTNTINNTSTMNPITCSDATATATASLTVGGSSPQTGITPVNWTPVPYNVTAATTVTCVTTIGTSTSTCSATVNPPATPVCKLTVQVGTNPTTTITPTNGNNNITLNATSTDNVGYSCSYDDSGVSVEGHVTHQNTATPIVRESNRYTLNPSIDRTIMSSQLGAGKDIYCQTRTAGGTLSANCHARVNVAATPPACENLTLRNAAGAEVTSVTAGQTVSFACQGNSTATWGRIINTATNTLLNPMNPSNPFPIPSTPNPSYTFGTPGNYTLRCDVSTINGEPWQTGPAACVRTLEVIAAPELTVDKRQNVNNTNPNFANDPSPVSVSAGDTINYRVTVYNNNTYPHNIRIQDITPSCGLTINDGGYTTHANRPKCIVTGTPTAMDRIYNISKYDRYLDTTIPAFAYGSPGSVSCYFTGTVNTDASCTSFTNTGQVWLQGGTTPLDEDIVVATRVGNVECDLEMQGMTSNKAVQYNQTFTSRSELSNLWDNGVRNAVLGFYYGGTRYTVRTSPITATTPATYIRTESLNLSTLTFTPTNATIFGVIPPNRLPTNGVNLHIRLFGAAGNEIFPTTNSCTATIPVIPDCREFYSLGNNGIHQTTITIPQGTASIPVTCNGRFGTLVNITGTNGYVTTINAVDSTASVVQTYDYNGTIPTNALITGNYQFWCTIRDNTRNETDDAPGIPEQVCSPITVIVTDRTICGDGIVQRPNSNGQMEECDDGNTTVADNNGCDQNCQLIDPLCTNVVLTGVPNPAFIAPELVTFYGTAYNTSARTTWGAFGFTNIMFGDTTQQTINRFNPLPTTAPDRIQHAYTNPGAYVYTTTIQNKFWHDLGLSPPEGVIIPSVDCTGNIVITTCGNGIVDEAYEECEDGRQCANGIACTATSDCAAVPGTDKTCQTRNNDGCNTTCQLERPVCVVTDRPDPQYIYQDVFFFGTAYVAGTVPPFSTIANRAGFTNILFGDGGFFNFTPGTPSPDYPTVFPTPDVIHQYIASGTYVYTATVINSLPDTMVAARFQGEAGRALRSGSVCTGRIQILLPPAECNLENRRDIGNTRGPTPIKYTSHGGSDYQSFYVVNNLSGYQHLLSEVRLYVKNSTNNGLSEILLDTISSPFATQEIGFGPYTIQEIMQRFDPDGILFPNQEIVDNPFEFRVEWYAPNANGQLQQVQMVTAAGANTICNSHINVVPECDTLTINGSESYQYNNDNFFNLACQGRYGKQAIIDFEALPSYGDTRIVNADDDVSLRTSYTYPRLYTFGPASFWHSLSPQAVPFTCNVRNPAFGNDYSTDEALRNLSSLGICNSQVIIGNPATCTNIDYSVNQTTNQMTVSCQGIGGVPAGQNVYVGYWTGTNAPILTPVIPAANYTTTFASTPGQQYTIGCYMGPTQNTAGLISADCRKTVNVNAFACTHPLDGTVRKAGGRWDPIPNGGNLALQDFVRFQCYPSADVTNPAVRIIRQGGTTIATIAGDRISQQALSTISPQIVQGGAYTVQCIDADSQQVLNGSCTLDFQVPIVPYCDLEVINDSDEYVSYTDINGMGYDRFGLQLNLSGYQTQVSRATVVVNGREIPSLFAIPDPTTNTIEFSPIVVSQHLIQTAGQRQLLANGAPLTVNLQVQLLDTNGNPINTTTIPGNCTAYVTVVPECNELLINGQSGNVQIVEGQDPTVACNGRYGSRAEITQVTPGTAPAFIALPASVDNALIDFAQFTRGYLFGVYFPITTYTYSCELQSSLLAANYNPAIIGAGAYTYFESLRTKCPAVNLTVVPRPPVYIEKAQRNHTKHIPSYTTTHYTDANIGAMSGDSFRYRLRVTNSGQATANPVFVTDYFPAEFSGITSFGQNCPASTTVTQRALSIESGYWEMNNLLQGQSCDIIIQGIITGDILNLAPLCEEDAYHNIAEVSYANTVSSDDTNADLFLPDLDITKFFHAASGYINSTGLLTINFVNTGTGNAHNVTVTDTLPYPLTYVRTVGGPAAITGIMMGGQEWMQRTGIELGTTVPSNTWSVTVEYYIRWDDSFIPAGVPYVTGLNTVEAVAPCYDPAIGTAVLAIYPRPIPGLEVAKTQRNTTRCAQESGGDPWHPTCQFTGNTLIVRSGDVLEYAIRFINTSTGQIIEDFVIVDDAPDASFASGNIILQSRSDGGTLTFNNNWADMQWSGINLLPRATGLIVWSGQILGTPGITSRRNTARGTREDGRLQTTGSSVLAILPLVSLTKWQKNITDISQLHGLYTDNTAITVTSGSRIGYKLEYRNDTQEAISNVVIADAFPDGFEPIDAYDEAGNLLPFDSESCTDGIDLMTGTPPPCAAGSYRTRRRDIGTVAANNGVNIYIGGYIFDDRYGRYVNTGYYEYTDGSGFDTTLAITPSRLTINKTQSVRRLSGGVLTEIQPFTSADVIVSGNDTVVYNLYFENPNTINMLTATNVIIEDTFPVGFRPLQWGNTWDGTNGTDFNNFGGDESRPYWRRWILGDMAPGTSGMITITGTLIDPSYRTFLNTGTMLCTQNEHEEQVCGEDTVLAQTLQFTVWKTAEPLEPQPGDAVRFRIKFKNVSATGLYEYEIRDLLPPTMQPILSENYTWTWYNNTGVVLASGSMPSFAPTSIAGGVQEFVWGCHTGLPTDRLNGTTICQDNIGLPADGIAEVSFRATMITQ